MNITIHIQTYLFYLLETSCLENGGECGAWYCGDGESNGTLDCEKNLDVCCFKYPGKLICLFVIYPKV